MVELHFKVRSIFRPLFDKLAKRFQVVVAHRRAGKTVASIQKLVISALTPERPNSRFAFVAPYRAQAKTVAWDYAKRLSRQATDIQINEAELRIDYPTGARLQLYGGDNPDSLRGAYLDGVVVDELAQMDPRVWDEVLRPMLADRQGWAVFIGTPMGRNLLFHMYNDAPNHEDWARYMFKASETGLIPELELAAARRSMSPEAYAQEWECSFTSAVRGAYYGKLMEEAEADGRITKVPYNPVLQCETAWDLGMRDSTAIWVVQPAPGGAVHVIDYIEGSGVGLDWYAEQLRNRRYRYTRHIAPQDINVAELGTGKTRAEVALNLGIHFEVCGAHRIPDGIEGVRALIPRMWFDRERCSRGIEALQLYRQEWDSKLQTQRQNPLHDWTSHAADAMRYYAMAPEQYTDWSEPPRLNLGVI